MIIAYSFIGDTLNWTPCSCCGLFETQQQWPQQTKSLTSRSLILAGVRQMTTTSGTVDNAIAWDRGLLDSRLHESRSHVTVDWDCELLPSMEGGGRLSSPYHQAPLKMVSELRLGGWKRMSGRRNSKCEVWSQQRVWADSWGRDPATGRTSNPRLGEGYQEITLKRLERNQIT